MKYRKTTCAPPALFPFHLSFLSSGHHRTWALAQPALGWLQVMLQTGKLQLQLPSKLRDTSPGHGECPHELGKPSQVDAGSQNPQAGLPQPARAFLGRWTINPTKSKVAVVAGGWGKWQHLQQACPHFTSCSKCLSPYVSCVWLCAAPHHLGGRITLTLCLWSTTRSSLQLTFPWHYLYFSIITITLESYKHLCFSPFTGSLSKSLPCLFCKAAPLLPHAPHHPAQPQATAGRWAITGQISRRERWVRAARFMSQSWDTNIFRKTLLQEQEEEDPKAVLHSYRFIWVLKPRPKTGRTQRGNYFLLIKRMKRPNIDFVLHHHTKNLPTTERMTVWIITTP